MQMHPCRNRNNWNLESDLLQEPVPVGADCPSMPHEGSDEDVPWVGSKRLGSKWLKAFVKCDFEKDQKTKWSKSGVIECLRSCDIKGNRDQSVGDWKDECKNTGKTSVPENCLPKVSWSLVEWFEMKPLITTLITELHLLPWT